MSALVNRGNYLIMCDPSWRHILLARLRRAATMRQLRTAATGVSGTTTVVSSAGSGSWSSLCRDGIRRLPTSVRERQKLEDGQRRSKFSANHLTLRAGSPVDMQHQFTGRLSDRRPRSTRVLGLVIAAVQRCLMCNC